MKTDAEHVNDATKSRRRKRPRDVRNFLVSERGAGDAVGSVGWREVRTEPHAFPAQLSYPFNKPHRLENSHAEAAIRPQAAAPTFASGGTVAIGFKILE